MFTLLALALAASPTPPHPDGTRLRPITQCFSILKDGQVIGATYQHVTAIKSGGQRRWDIVIHQRIASMQFDMRDHFVLAHDDLRPVSFENSRFGEPHVVLTYGPDHVTGSRLDKGNSTPIDVALPQPVWEGNLWGITFGAMPLTENAKFDLPFYQYDKGLDQFHLAVTGSEDVATPTGKVAAWTLEMRAGAKGHATYLIGKATGEELGVRAGTMATRLGGDCSGLT